MTPYRIHSDIRLAETLPGSFYRSQEVFDALLDRAFARSWQWLGDVQTLVPKAGAVAPITLLPGAVDEPLLLSRDGEGVRCLSNVCTHRGNLLVHEAGCPRQLVCGYHGRRFGLDGRFQSMPRFEEAEGFPRPCDDLHRFPLHDWRGHLFAGLDPAHGAEAVLAAMEERIGFLPVEDFRLDPARDRTFLIEAHWALYCDNYLEGFHIPFVHQDLNAVVDFDRYETVLFEHGNLQIAEARDGEEVFALPAGHVDEGRAIAAYYFWLFPNLMFNFYPWGLSVNVVEPLSVDRTRVRFQSFVHSPELLGPGAGGDLDTVEHEDEEVVESVQRGIRSRGYTTGRFSPTMEQGVHQFHRMLADVLG